MNKFIGIVLTIIVLFGFLVPQMFLSKSFAMHRAAVIDAPQGTVQAKIADLVSWREWTAWNKEADPTVEYTYTGDPGTVGHSMEWTGEELGQGKLTLTSVEAGRVGYDMEMDGSGGAQGAFILEPAKGGATGTAIRWEFSGTMEGMPYERYFGTLMDRMVGPDFEKGLASLKAQLEGAK